VLNQTIGPNEDVLTSKVVRLAIEGITAMEGEAIDACRVRQQFSAIVADGYIAMGVKAIEVWPLE